MEGRFFKDNLSVLGDIGVGTSSPITKLNIKGDQSANGQLYIEPTNDGEYAGLVIKTTRGADRAYAIFAGGTGTDDLNFRFRDASAGADRMVIDSSGKVGIGTDDPASVSQGPKLAVVHSGAGIATFDATGANGGYITITDSNIPLAYLGSSAQLISSGGTTTDAALRSQGELIFATNGSSERMRIDSSGNVGIGTTDPGNHKLKVVGETHSTHFITGFDWTAKTGGLHIGNDGLTTGAVSFYNGSNSSANIYRASDTFYVGARGGQSTQGLAIDGSGNVGIGITPLFKLHANGDIYQDVGYSIYSNANRGWYRSNYTTTGSGVSNGKIVTLNPSHGQTASSNYHYIFELTTIGTSTNSGATYIGVYSADTSAWSLRAVSLSGSTSNHPQLSVSGNNFTVYTNHSSNYTVVVSVTTVYNGDADSTAHSLGANYQWQRAVNDLYYNDGLVGIGTGTPSQKLHVQGNLRVTGAYYDSNNEAGTSNQVLTSTGSGGTDWKSLSDIGDTVTGSGTTNYVTKWSNGANSDLTNSLIYDNGTNVGISTASPSAKLHVHSTTGILHTGDNYSSWVLKYLSNQGSGSAVINYYLIAAKTQTNVRFDGVLKGARQVGTSATGSGGARITFYTNNAGTPLATGGLESWATDSYGHPIFKLVELTYNSVEYYAIEISPSTSWSAAFAHVQFEGYANNVLFTNLGTASVSGVTEFSGEESVFSYKYGNLGIGTDGPEGKLHIFTGNSGGSVNSSAGELVIESESTGGIQFLNGSTASGYILFGDSGGNSTGQIRYLHSDDSMRVTTANVERLIINSSGKVGIGTTNPSRKLHVNGTIKAGIAGNSSANTPALLVASAGTSPQQSAIAIQQDTTEGDTIIFADYEPYVEYGINTDNGSDTIEFTAGTSTNNLGSKTLYNQSGNARTAYKKVIISLTSGNMSVGGNVGIGTDSPEGKLHIYGGDLDTREYQQSNPTNSIYLNPTNGNADGTSNTEGGGVIWKTWYNNYTKKSAGILAIGEGNYFRSGLAFYTNNNANQTTDWSEKMRIDMDGNVGIGTTDPNSLLHIDTGANSAANFRLGANRTVANAAVGQIVGDWNGTVVSKIALKTGDDTTNKDNGEIAFEVAAAGSTAEAMRIDSARNVGIGTTSPSDKLHVVQNIDLNTALFKNTSGRAQVIIDSQSTAHNSYLTLSNGGTEFAFLDAKTSINLLRIATNNTGAEIAIETNSQDEAVRIDSSGNVGIGNASPNDKLDIHGNMRVRGSDGFGATSTANYNPSYVAFPGGGKIGSASSSQAGYVKITLPQSWTSTMMQFSVDIFEYQVNEAKTFVLAGYNYTSGSKWVNASAMVLAADDGSTYKVQFGHDGSKCAIYISKGTSGASSSWTYPYVVVRDASFGFTSTGISNWIDGWSVSFTTSLGTITQTRDVNTQVTGTGTSQYITKWSSTGTEITDSVIVQDNNNIGIGIANPTQKLHVVGAVKSTTNFTAETAANAAYFDHDGTNARITSKGADVDTLGGFKVLQQASDGFPNNAPIEVQIDGDVLLAQSSGDVGIGITSPANPLHIKHSGTTTDQALFIHNTSNGNDAGIKFSDHVSATQNGIFYYAHSDAASNGTGNSFHFNSDQTNLAVIIDQTNGNSGYYIGETSPVVAIRGGGNSFFNGGNVGIGNTNPQGTLDLGNATGGKSIVWGGSSGTNHYTSIWSEYGTGSLVLAGGLKSSTTAADFIYPYTGTYGYAAIELDSFHDDGIKFYTAADAARTAGAVATKQERMRIDTSGNVGIGTTGPGAKLAVRDGQVTIYDSLSTPTYGDGSQERLRVGRSASQSISFQVNDLNNYITAYQDESGTEAHRFILDRESSTSGIHNFHIARNGSYQVTVDRVGNVGIGTADPNQKLHVSGGSTNLPVIRLQRNDTSVVPDDLIGGFENYSNDADGAFISSYIKGYATETYGRQGYLTFGTAGTNSTDASEKMRIKADGNVGIGTPTPDVKLEVIASPADGIIADFVNGTNAGGTTAAIKLSNADSEACDVVLGANRVNANFGSDFFISLSDNVDGTNQERFRITEAGSVGIGITNPGVALHVNGSAVIGDASRTSTTLTIRATNTAGSPAATAKILMEGYEGRGIGTFYTDSTYSGEEWFCGMNYSGNFNSWNIGYDQAGGEAEYLANTLFQLHHNGKLQLHAYGAGTFTGTATQRLAVDASGNVIEIAGGIIDGSGTEDYVARWTDTDTLEIGKIRDDNSTVAINTAPDSNYMLKVGGNGYFSGTLTEASSLAIKENIENFTPSIDKINKIRPVKYNKKGTDKKEIGLIAEELEELFPELVEKDENGNPSGVNYSRAVTVLLGGFKELYKELQEIKKRI